MCLICCNNKIAIILCLCHKYKYIYYIEHEHLPINTNKQIIEFKVSHIESNVTYICCGRRGRVSIAPVVEKYVTSWAVILLWWFYDKISNDKI